MSDWDSNPNPAAFDPNNLQAPLLAIKISEDKTKISISLMDVFLADGLEILSFIDPSRTLSLLSELVKNGVITGLNDPKLADLSQECLFVLNQAYLDSGD